MTDTRAEFEVVVPRLNSVDDNYILTSWLIGDGTVVTSGMPLVTIESSKAASELDAPVDGVVRHRVAEGSECAIGEVIAIVERTGSGARPEPVVAAADPPAARAGSAEPVITAPARRLAATHNISHDRLRELDLPVIRETDVAALIGAAENRAPLTRLSPNQIAVGAAVAKSHREIPTAYAAVAVRVDAAQAAAVQHSRAVKALVGITELTVRAIARQKAAFPHFFASLADATSLRISETADIGVTMDVEHGLFVPVVRNAAALAPAELARELMRLRRKAAEGTLTAADLEQPSIVLALNNAHGVTSAVPIVFPGTTACVSLSAARRRVELDENGTVIAISEVEISVSYDHRVVNGLEAGAFLASIRGALDDPQTLLRAEA